MRWLVSTALLFACGGRAPVTATPIAQVPPLDDIVRTCAFEVSCLKNPPASTMNTCVGAFEVALSSNLRPFFSPVAAPDYRRYLDCATAATDCTTVLRCASRNHDPSYCAAHSQLSCDGDLLISCGGGSDWAIFTTDCAAFGMHCAAANGSAACSDGSHCDPTTASDHCDGNRWVTCDRTTQLRSTIDCSRWPIPNATCRGSDGCLPSGAPCSGDRCDGNILVSCVDGEEVRRDCAQLASSCGGAPPVCVAVATECTYTTQDQCAGNGIQTCVDGMLRTVDCATIGLSTCTHASGGQPTCG